ncbi:pyruvate dehydrogenase [Rhodobacterales bacterium]|nr:pyruvate dehydrogenase [Rhodobacterales bacterium]
MPHEVIMPALGMAQDTGQLLAWHKKPGEAVSAGDVLFEVETDKAAMEVEAQSGGYLTDVSGEAGTDIPVGQVIALISETPEDSGAASSSNGAAPETPSEPNAGEDALPEGKSVIMPTLGMAQDTGLLIGWRKAPGEAVGADDVLFEVETDKSAVEVNAGFDGFVAALLAEAGEEVPVGQTIAIISAEKPEKPVQRSMATGAAGNLEPPPAAAEQKDEPEPAAPSPVAQKTGKPAAQSASSGGRVLASPKARRLAREQGLDLALLAEAGREQPYHVKDLETLKALPPARPDTAPAAVPVRHLSAEIDGDGFDAFAVWAGESAGLRDANALIAGLAAVSFGSLPAVVAVESAGRASAYTVPAARLGEVSKAKADAAPDLKVRDLRHSRISALGLGAEDCPVISIVRSGSGVGLILECAGHHLAAEEAVSLLSNFAGRMEQPLRHLL